MSSVFLRSLVPLLIGCGATGDSTNRPTTQGHPASFVAAPSATLSPSASSSPEPPPIAPEPLALFSSEPRVRSLDLPGFQQAHLVLPRGEGRTKARLAVVAHGAGERPEPHCDHYGPLLGDEYLLACTRGFPNNSHLPEPERGYFYDGHHRLGDELTALFETLSKTEPFASGVELNGALYVGFSQGATMGILALHEEPELAVRFNGILLVDGGSGEWTVALAKRMAERNTRVAIVCGNAACREKAERSRSWLRHAGLENEMRLSTARHFLGGRLAEDVKSVLPWLLRAEAE